jgi:steroid 5-alpha reductase family enzyme
MELVLTATACCVLMMFGLWLLHFPLRNAAIVDAGWSFGMPLCALVYAWRADGWPNRAWLLVAMTALWGLRLGGYLLFTRVFGHPEEGRYVTLREKWKTNIPLKFLLFYQVQAILCGLLSIPYYFVASNPHPGFAPLEAAGVALWFIGWTGESLADWQLWRFKSNPTNRGKTCRGGLWRYSRHPNYFFELIVWIGWAVYAMPSPHGYWGLASAALLYYFLMHVTGIRPTEAQALRTKGQDYMDYQKTTNAFFPWFPKKGG